MAEHFCNEHQVKFFKTAKMSGYAHPIKVEDQTVGWCNEDVKEVAKLPAQKTASPPLQEGGPTAAELKATTNEMTKGDWSEKDRVTRQSIQRQTSLKAAVEWCIAGQNTETVKTVMVITVAGLFEAYLENGVQVEKKK